MGWEKNLLAQEYIGINPKNLKAKSKNKQTNKNRIPKDYGTTTKGVMYP